MNLEGNELNDTVGNTQSNKVPKYVTSFSTQFFALLRRSFYKSLSEHWTFLFFLEVWNNKIRIHKNKNIITGLLIGGIWIQTPFQDAYFVTITGLVGQILKF